MSITNREFGERIGVTHSMASRIRHGQRLPGVSTMERISEEFGISMRSLLAARKKDVESEGGASHTGELIEKRLARVKASPRAA